MVKDRELELLDRQVDALRTRTKDSASRKTYDQVFDHPALLNLAKLISEGVLATLDYPVSTGKEANVFHGTGPDGRGKAVKIYRINTATFRDIARYIEGDRRFKGVKRGTKSTILAWARKEHKNLLRMADAGVRVPRPYNFLKGVLLMELVTDDNGDAAPRLNDLVLTAEQSRAYHRTLITQVVRMLCAGVIHGDLSEYNVLVGGEGPVIIDLPQAIDAAGNNNARSMLERDVANLAAYFGRFAPEILSTDYGMEIWSLYENGKLHPEIELTGRFERSEKPADVDSVMREVDAAFKEEAARQRYKQEMGQ